MKTIAVIPGKPDTVHLRDVPKPYLTGVDNGRGVLAEVLRVGVDGTDKEINAAAGADGSKPWPSPWGKRSGAHLNLSVTLRSQDSQDSTDYSRAASENEKVSPHERSTLRLQAVRPCPPATRRLPQQ